MDREQLNIYGCTWSPSRVLSWVLEDHVQSRFWLWHMKLQVWHQLRAPPAISSFLSEVLDVPVIEREGSPLHLWLGQQVRFQTDLCCRIAWDALAFCLGTWSEWSVFSACMLWSCPCVDSAFVQDLYLFACVVVYFLGWEWEQSSVIILMPKSTFRRLFMALLLLWGST